MGACLLRGAALLDDEVGIAVEVAHAGVHLGEGEAQLGHVSSLSTGIRFATQTSLTPASLPR